MALLFVIILTTILHVRGQTSIEDALCERLYLKIGTDDIPHRVLEGVYTMEPDLYSGFPLYKGAGDGGYYLYYNHQDIDYHLFMVGPSVDTYVMFAQLRYNPISWTDWLGTTDDPFSRLVDQWYYYESRSDENVPLGSHGNIITFRCLDDQFRLCPSGRFSFSHNVTQVDLSGESNLLSQAEVTYFSKMQGVFREGRPVFSMMDGATESYLFYTKGVWAVGRNYLNQDMFMRCVDRALHPEFMECAWLLYTEGYFQTQRDLRLICRGIPYSGGEDVCLSNTSAASNPCHHDAPCSVNSLKEVVCNCPHGYHGDSCEIISSKCPDIAYLQQHSFTVTGAYEGVEQGQIVAHVCENEASGPNFLYGVCVVRPQETSATWNVTGQCSPPPTTTTGYPSTPYPTNPPEPWDPDKVTWLEPVVVTFAVFLQFFMPFIIFWLVRRRQQSARAVPLRRRRSSRNERNKRRTELTSQIQDTFGKWSADLDQVRQSHPELSDASIQDYPEDVKSEMTAINVKYKGAVEQAETEISGLDYSKDAEKQKSGSSDGRTPANLGRVLSIYLFWSFWLWMIYTITCGATVCGLYGSVFGALLIFAIVMLPLSYLYVIIECCCSRELQYLKNLGDVENVQTIITTMQEGCPVVIMTATAWHMEQQTRVVTTTDANGNTSSQLQTYWVRVNSAVVTEPFLFGYWLDNSDEQVTGIRKKGVTKIKMSLSIQFGDVETETAFTRRFSEFRERTQFLDINVDHTVDRTLPGFEKRVATYLDKNTVPKWMNKIAYWVTAFFCLTWVFRWAFQLNVAKASYNIRKDLYLNQPEGIPNVRQIQESTAGL